jgi:hypothetical protein
MRKLLGKPREFVDAGENFMTPRVVGYYRVGNFAVELSTGEGFKHEPIWGVTVKTRDGVTVNKLCAMFWSIGSAISHIGDLADDQ